MTTQTTMLHVRVNEQIKAEAAQKLENIGLTLSDAVRILLTRIAKEGCLPPGLVAPASEYDAWFKEKVLEALNDTSPGIPHAQVMGDIQALLDRKLASATD